MPSDRPEDSRSKVPADVYRLAGVGLQFAATIGVFALLGWWLDRKLGTSPWLLVVGVFAGFAGGLFSMVSRVQSSLKRPRPKAQSPDDPTR